MKKMYLALLGITLLSACGGVEVAEDGTMYVEPVKGASFEEPDVKDDFCGIHINYQFCKCAFHNDYCDAIGMDKSGANAHVASEFGNHVAGLLKSFAEACELGGGFVDSKTCYVCPEETELDGRRCKVVSEDAAEEESESSEANNEDISCEEVEEDWEKYSDIDWRIPAADRSFEAKNYALAQDNLVQTVAEQAELQYETELLRQQLADVKEYKAALVDNLRDNLVKATLRLAYVTYSQVDGAKGSGKAFGEMLTSAASIKSVGTAIKTVQSVIPGDSRLAINTKTAAGKVKSAGWNATLEAIESMGDPVAIATQVTKDARAAAIPSADISPEEIEILRVQNLENNLLDQVIAELEAEIADNEMWLSVANARIAELEAEVAKWKTDERDRVLLLFSEECEW